MPDHLPFVQHLHRHLTLLFQIVQREFLGQRPLVDQLLKARPQRVMYILGRAGGVVFAPLYGRLGVLQWDKPSQLQQELAEVVHKSDYRFHEDVVGQEGDSWRCAIAMVLGVFGI